MRRFLMLVACLLLILRAGYAQNYIHGTVSGGNGRPLAGAIISLLNDRDSTLLKTAVSDSSGTYRVARIGMGSKVLKAEKNGMVTQAKMTGESDSIVNFELISIRALEEVVITDRKKLIEQKMDRTVFNVENSVVAFGGDALEALKKMPGIQVAQQQITIAGNSGLTIMVNGRTQHLSGDELIQFLRSIPASTLSRIELITSPGAKYDAEGNAGVINLLTKKSIRDGLVGSVSASYNRNTYGSPSGGLSMQYKMRKFTFYTNDNINEWNWLYTNRADFYYLDQRWKQSVQSEYSNKNARVQAGIDYSLQKNMMVGFVYTKGFGGNDAKDHISSSRFRRSELADSIIRSEGTMHEVCQAKHTVNLSYEWKIDTLGKKLSVNADYFSQRLSRERNFDVRSFSGGAILHDELQNRIFENPAITIRSANADLELPFSYVELSIGAKASFVDNEGSFIYQTLANTGFVADSSRSNHFLYREQIEGAYLSARKKVAAWEIKAGLRAERTETTGRTSAVPESLGRNYTQLFPAVSIGYKPSEDCNLVFSYMRRIERPGYNLLNPFKTYFTENSYQQGNPALRPVFTNGFQAALSFNGKYQLRVRVNQVSDYFDRIYFTDSILGISVVSRANLGKAMFYVLNFSFSEDISRRWELAGEVSGTYNRFWLNAYETESGYSGISGWIELNNTFYLNRKKTWIAELNGYYYSPRQKDYKLWKEMHNLNGGIKCLLLDKALSIGIAFDDPFTSSRWYQTNKENGTTEYSYDDERSISFSLSYRFGNKNLKAGKEKLETNEEIQRAK